MHGLLARRADGGGGTVGAGETQRDRGALAAPGEVAEIERGARFRQAPENQARATARPAGGTRGVGLGSAAWTGMATFPGEGGFAMQLGKELRQVQHRSPLGLPDEIGCGPGPPRPW